MDNTNNNDIWVFIETDEEGTAAKASLELLNPGMSIADEAQGKLVAVLFGSEIEKTIEEVSQYGVDQIIAVDGAEFKEYSTDAFSVALSTLLVKYAPMGILIAATENGRDFSPRVACRLRTGLTADCIGVELDRERGCLIWTRPAFGGNLMACIVCGSHRPQMGTIRPGTYNKKKTKKSQIEIIKEEVDVKTDLSRVRLYKTITEEEGIADLENADIIIAGGKGVGSAEGFRILYDLAEALGGEVGASRGAVEEGWISHSHQVGQTGKTVKPRIYVACGISGAIQHLAGMSASDTIIAINNDRTAPIFSIADYGIIGDLEKVIPALTEKIRKDGINKKVD